MSLLTAMNLSANHRICVTSEDLQRMVMQVRDQKTVAIDFETSGLKFWDNDKPIGVALGFTKPGEAARNGGVRAFYVPVAHQTHEAQADPDQARLAVKDALVGCDSAVLHNAKFDLNMGRADNWQIADDVAIHDTMVQAYLINESRPLSLEKVVEEEDVSPYGDAHDLKDQVEEWIRGEAKRHRIGRKEYLNRYGHAQIPVALEGEYACRDIGHTLALHEAQFDRARGIGEPYEFQRKYLYDNEMNLVRALADMEWHGQRLDVDYLQRVSLQIDQELEDLSKKLTRSFGTTLEWHNDRQVRGLLFEDLKLPVNSRTRGGAASADRAALVALVPLHPGIEPLMEWRALYKVRTTYTDSLINKIDRNNKLHTSFLQIGTATGRLSSRNPNLQNIPSRHPRLSKLVRRAFVCDPGQVRIYCDYSQIELRILAWITRCPTFLTAYASPSYSSYREDKISYEDYIKQRAKEEDTDVHGLVAQTVFGAKPEDDNWKQQRSAAKICSFGLAYGAGPSLLMANPDLSMSEAAARNYHASYLRRNPEIEDTKKSLIRKMLRDPDTCFVNWAGRKRHGARLRWQRRPEGDCPVAEEERSMFASLVQGSAGELTRFSLVGLWKAQQRGDLPAITTSTVHDEIQVDCDAKDLNEVAYEVRREMENFRGCFGNVPIVADLEKTDRSWAEKQNMDI